MNIVHRLWQKITLLFYIKTGLGNKDIDISAESEASAAIFLPLFGLLIGSIAVLAAFLMQTIGFSAASVIAGLAILVVFGGYKQFSVSSKLFRASNSATGSTVITILLLLFEAFALAEISSRGGISLLSALLYMPVAEAMATLSAASVLHEDEMTECTLSAVKGWHMLSASILTFVLMLPQFGVKSIVYISASILAGSITALALSKTDKKEMAASIAAIISNILFLICLMLLNHAQVYY